MNYDDERVNRVYDFVAKIITWAFIIFFFGIGALRIFRVL